MAGETFAEMTAVAFPGLAGGIESFQTWEVADWSLGCEVRDGKRATLDGQPAPRPPRCRISAPRERCSLPIRPPVVGLVCLANRSTYSGWMMRPGGWPDLCDAVLAGWGSA